MYLSLFMINERLLKQGFTICRSHLDEGESFGNVRLFDSSDFVEAKRQLLVGSVCEFYNTPYHDSILDLDDDAILCVCGSDYFAVVQKSLVEVLNACLAVCEYFNHYEETLMQAVHQKATLQQLIDLAAPYYQNPLFVANWQGDVLAYTKDIDGKSVALLGRFWQEVTANNRVPIYSVKAFADMPGYADMLRGGNPCILSFPMADATALCATQRRKAKYHIHFQVIQNETVLTQTHIHLASTFMQAMSLINFDEQLEKAVSATSLFVDLLDAKPVSQDSLHWVLTSLGWDPCDHILLLLFATKSSRLIPEALYGQMAYRLQYGLCIFWNDTPILLIHEEDFSRNKNIIKMLSCDLGFFCGVSYPIEDWSKLPLYCRQAQTAIEHRLPDAVISLCADHTWEILLNELKQTMKNSMLCHPAVGILQKYDKEKDAQLIFTLQTYLENECNATLTAEKLFIHRNTMQYRLSLIHKLAALDLGNTQQRIHLLLSCWILNSNVTAHN
ncbi:helix-turn-helix domain-containing protein [Lachnospiraceae bacterium ZAX-1]